MNSRISTSANFSTSLVDNWTRFCGELRSDNFISFASKKFSSNETWISQRLEYYIAEANLTFEIVSNQPLLEKRLLEIGAGAGFLAAFFEKNGLDIISIEPFDSWYNLVGDYFELDKSRRLSLKIEQLDPAIHGKFDLIFSNNVLEHVEDFELCISLLIKLLPTGGNMIHNTPNYLVPFEPHFCIPLVPVFPRLTRFLIPIDWRNSDLWRSLNFVTYFEACRCAKKYGCKIELTPGLLSKQFRRLLVDREFAQRHRILFYVAKFLNDARLLKLIESIPASCTTPMIVNWRKVHSE